MHRGESEVRALYGVKAALPGVAMALLATTSHFTRSVHEFRASRWDFELKDYEGVLDWLNTYRPNPNGKPYLRDNRLVLPGESRTGNPENPGTVAHSSSLSASPGPGRWRARSRPTTETRSSLTWLQTVGAAIVVVLYNAIASRVVWSFDASSGRLPASDRSARL